MSEEYQKDAKWIKRDGVKYPRVSYILEKVGVVDTRYYNESGAERGTIVHNLTGMIDSGLFVEDDFPREYAGYLSAYLRFLNEAKPKIIGSEKEVIYFNKLEKTYYIGHLDRLMEMNRAMYLVDIKTGQIEKWHGLQLAAYAMALGEDVKKAILQLKPDGKYRLVTKIKNISLDDEVWAVNWRIALRKFFKEYGESDVG